MHDARDRHFSHQHSFINCAILNLDEGGLAQDGDFKQEVLAVLNSQRNDVETINWKEQEKKHVIHMQNRRKQWSTYVTQIDSWLETKSNTKKENEDQEEEEGEEGEEGDQEEEGDQGEEDQGEEEEDQGEEEEYQEEEDKESEYGEEEEENGFDCAEDEVSTDDEGAELLDWIDFKRSGFPVRKRYKI
jgi:hypothetical protein